jgi:hypothetical protein
MLCRRPLSRVLCRRSRLDGRVSTGLPDEPVRRRCVMDDAE